MPTIVQQHRTPATTYVAAIHQPARTIHRMFAISDGRPPPPTTCFPNGASVSAAIFMHCLPSGMPTIVTYRTSPTMTHSNAVTKPPHSIQMMLPIVRTYNHVPAWLVL